MGSSDSALQLKAPDKLRRQERRDFLLSLTLAATPLRLAHAAQLPAQPGSTSPPPKDLPQAAFPLSTRGGQRHLSDATGAPFLLRGEAAWGLIAKLRRDEARAYLSDRRAKGFNAVVVMLVAHHQRIGAPTNAYGDPPFTNDDNFMAPNEAYFRHADEVIATAEGLGMLVVLAPAYSGYGGTDREGWMPWVRAQGTAGMRAYGHWVGLRYRHNRNILWLIGGDHNPANSVEREAVRALAQGVRDAIPQALQTFHGVRNTAALHFWGTAEPWLTVNCIYTRSSNVVASAMAEYTRSTMPFFLVEGGYEFSQNVDAAVVRSQAYQAVLSGATGCVIGQEGLWEFGPDWRERLETPGAQSMPTLARTLAAVSWWKLQPDLGAALLVAGTGGDAQQAVAAVTADRRSSLIYLPTSRTVTLDLARMAGPWVHARWVDPLNGRLLPASRTYHPAQGRLSIQSPRINSGLTADWLLWLQSVAGPGQPATTQSP